MLASLPSQLTTDKKYFNYNRGIELLEQAPYLDKPGKQALNQEARVRRIQEKIKEMNKTCGKKLNTVPQVVIDGEHIGGFTETERYINQKK